MKKRRNTYRSALISLLSPIAALAILLAFSFAVGNLGDRREAEEMKQLEDAIRTGCIACYSVEGVYPPDIEYLENHYGVQINKDKYTVYYDIFAENLMPDITVLVNEL